MLDIDDAHNTVPMSKTTNSIKTDGRQGVVGAAVIGRRDPHPIFLTPETASRRCVPSFPAYEPLYTLCDDEVSTNAVGLHCAYAIVASRWIVASWCDTYGEFVNLEAEPLEFSPSSVFSDTSAGFAKALEWLIERTSALSEQLAFAYGTKASARLHFERVVICRLGECMPAERDLLVAACAFPPSPLSSVHIILAEMSCFEPEIVPRYVASSLNAGATTADIIYVVAVVAEAEHNTVKTYALPSSSTRSFVAHNANASSVQLRALNDAASMAHLKELCALYASRLSQLGMMCLDEISIDDTGSLRAPLPVHAEVCVRFAGALQTMEIHGD
jgi:hypothetical protein